MADKMNGLKRTHYCTELSTANIGETVVVAGWAQKTRDKGSLVFIDLRDRTGIVQLSFDERTARDVFTKAQSVRAEFVLMAKGVVTKRESVNKEIATGEIEVFVEDLRILSAAQTPPFPIIDNTDVKEDLRLKYRYLDLRRGVMQQALRFRHQIVKAARDYYDENGFLEIETPILIKSSPEGARDYLVPSRVHPGAFYALPQSPQQYKQLLMLSGFDRYMQITRCFRDEDLRADRQPEFTQIDLEMSFVDEEDVRRVNEGFIKYLFKRVLNVDVPTPFVCMPYDEAMARYGSDKPDTRFGMELVDLSDVLKDSTFKVFEGALSAGGSVRAINVKGKASELPRKKIDKLVDVVKTYRAKGLAFTRITEDNAASSYEKFLTPEEVAAVREKMNAEVGDVILIVADARNDIVCESLGQLRCYIAKELNMIPKGVYNFLWVVDFPLFEYDEEHERWSAKHHPFTMCKDEDIDKLLTDPGHCYAKAYDIILNGCELGGGSIRINDPEIQEKMFAALGFTHEAAMERFGFLINAFSYGAPPHGGMAYGLDRLVMLMLDKDSIRDVIAFPKVQSASELMTDCPAEVDPEQLAELHIQIVSEDK